MSCKIENNVLVRIIGKHYQKAWFFSSESGDEDTIIPFEILNGWTVITVKLNGEEIEHKFIFDTGAITKVEPDIAEALNLTNLRDFTKTDLNGVRSPASLVNLKIVKIGKRTFSKVGALSSHTSLFKCYGIKGIIGYNIMRDAIFIINNKNQTITITKSKIKFNKNHFQFAKIDNDWRGVMYLTLKIDRQRIKAVLDTGFPYSVNLHKSLERELDENYLIKRKRQFLNAANSSVLDTLSFFKPHKLKLNNLKLDKYTFILSNTRTIVGNEFLSGFEEVVLDFKKSRIYLSNKHTEKKQEGKVLNFTLGWSEGIVKITGLAIGSQLEEMGLSLGDHVISINGLRTSSFQDDCAFKNFDSETDIYESDINLTVMRGDKQYNYVISKSMIYG